MAFTIFWNVDSDGDWATAANWSPVRLPDVTDDVQIDTADRHTVTFSTGAATMHSLTVGNDDFVLSGGTLTTSANSTFAHDLTISGGSLVVGGGVSGVGGVFTDTVSNSVSLTSGKLYFDGGGTAPVSAFALAAGTTLVFDGFMQAPIFTLTGGGTLGSAGSQLRLNSGTLAITDDTTIAGQLDLTGTTLDLGVHDLTFTGNVLEATGFTVEGSGTLTFAGGAPISVAYMEGIGEVVLQGATTVQNFVYADDGKVIENQGTMTLSGSVPSFDLGYGNWVGPTSSASLVNDAGATMIFAGSQCQVFTLRTPTTFTNDGTLINTANAHSLIADVAFVDNGLVQLQGGSLTIQAGMTGSGTVEIDPDATLILDASATATPNAVNITSGSGLAHLIGGSTSDSFAFGGNFAAADTVDGGGGNDTLVLNGDYSGGLTLAAATMTNIETLTLATGHSYDLTTDNATVGAGQVLTVDGSALGAGDSLVFNGVAETDGSFMIKAGAGIDTLTGGSGNDSFFFGANFTAADTVNGGPGTNDQIGLQGDYSAGLTLGATTITGVEVIACLAGFSYKLTTVDANVAAGGTLTIWAASLSGGNTLTFDGSAERDGHFVVYGGAGNDIIAGGASADTLWGLGGADTLIGNGGADVFAYQAAPESTGAAHDTIVGFDAASDAFDLPVQVRGIDTPVAAGVLSAANFDADMALAVNAGNLAAGHAVLFTPQGVDYAGHTFLVVDANGAAGYQAGADFVFDVTGGSLASLSTSDFV